jgi:hypothetical protein
MVVVISKAIRPTSLGTGVAEIQLGGASQKAPEWAKEFLGFAGGGALVTPTAAEGSLASVRVASNDFSCYPSTVPAIISAGAIATVTSPASMPLEYWPCDWPIHGGDAYDIYATSAVACTAAPYFGTTQWFGDGDGIMPSRHDAYPHVPRFHTGSGAVATASVAQALTAYTITGAKAITQLHGYLISTAGTASRDEVGRIQLNSNGFFTSPVEFGTEPLQGFLGTTMANGVSKVTRSDVMLPCSPTTIINPVCYQDSVTAVTTARGYSGVTFIR